MSLLEKGTYVPAAILSGVSFILCSVLCSAILLSPKSRSKGFNIYLVFLLLPDIFLNLNTFIIYTIELSEDKFLVMLSFEACVYQASIYIYFLFCNMWTSALICHEVHQLLVKSYRAERFTPSKPLTVIKRTSVIHIFAVLCVLIIYVILPKFDIDSRQDFCMEYVTRKTDIVIYFFVIGMTTCIPLLYLFYVTFDVYWRKLLPPAGKSRFVATFFLRTTFVCTMLTILVIFSLVIREENTWRILIIGISGQGAVVAGLSIMKPDVRKTVWLMLTCQKPEQYDGRATVYGSVTNGMRSSTFTKSTLFKSMMIRKSGNKTKGDTLASVVESKEEELTEQ